MNAINATKPALMYVHWKQKKIQKTLYKNVIPELNAIKPYATPMSLPTQGCRYSLNEKGATTGWFEPAIARKVP